MWHCHFYALLAQDISPASAFGIVFSTVSLVMDWFISALLYRHPEPIYCSCTITIITSTFTPATNLNQSNSSAYLSKRILCESLTNKKCDYLTIVNPGGGEDG